ncbi:glycoside hydrolase family 2 TIM barrel-domain containing protein [Propioniciclava tarda]|uniref:DUF4982 domain-containing protein n=1 Tax=Propioniciclava tarda TaxID=433330 RepID=A0A4Q9KIJ3_PROTD|nr:glycoside hydrolase family 2 TIM barrel-domain containing protein [Propioniciclava tarda]TBT94232.1 DUF4982 domain-containing protein [Propioniciclava tarda]SMO75198.1 Beta-galactosidase/beta-glucuronidase [Propioniciclava tarda]
MRIEFDHDWFVRTPLGPFAVVQGVTADPKPVTLPHDALRDAERTPGAPARGASAYYPNGAYTYLKTFDVPAEWANCLVRLEFQGAMRHAMVYVNDELAGNRSDGYARFWVDATPFLREGANELRVEVRTGEDSRWYSGAGLHRSVVLHVDELVHVAPDGVTVTTVRVDDGQAVVEVATRVANASARTATASLLTVLRGPSGAEVGRDGVPVTVPPGETVVARQRFYLPDPELWSDESPALYEASVSLDAAETTVTFGVRTIAVDPKRGLLLNGRPVKLRGACLHHDNGPLGGAAIARAEERRVELLRAAGFNAIRSAHNPLSPAMLHACDRLGMLVMDEAFDMWVRGKSPYDYALDFPQWWRADLAALVAKDRNHPSVIMYSLGNEIAEVGTPHGAFLARSMAEHVRILDPTRLVTNGVNSLLAVMDDFAAQVAAAGGLNELMAEDPGASMTGAAAGENVTRRTAESHSVLDVVGLNYGETRYAMDAELFPARVIVGSETFGPEIGRLWPLVVEHPHVIGDFCWTGWDYLGEVGIGSVAYASDAAPPGLEREFPWLTAWCGDLDITGWRRPLSFYREIAFGLRSEPYLAVLRPSRAGDPVVSNSPWAWSDSVSAWTWPGFEGRVVEVEVYADADEVALVLNGAEVARGPVGERRPLLASFSIEYQPGELVAVAYRGSDEVGRHGLATAGAASLVLSVDRPAIRAEASDLAYVTIELRDASGVLVTCAEADVTVEVSGPGVLAGMCSANPSTTERFEGSTWRTFDGRALAVVRPTGPGEIVVTARSEALGEAVVTVRALPVGR